MKLLRLATIFASFWTVSLFAIGASGADANVAVQRYPLPQRGYFELRVPSNWQAQLKQPKKPVPPTIAFAAREGQPFVLTVTPIWRTEATKLPRTKEALRKRVTHSAAGIRPFAVERDVSVIELKGATGPGFYFSATDKAPRAGGYKFMTKGRILVNDLNVVFTILTNEGQESIVRDALDMLQSAIHVPAVPLKK